MSLVFLDTETGGLDPVRHELVEIAWSVDGGTIKSVVVPHDPEAVSPEAAAVNGYYERGLNDRSKWSASYGMERLAEDLVDATVIGANPGFDAEFIRRSPHFDYAWGDEPWHYRMLDIESMAHLLLPEPQMNRPRGMKGLTEMMRTQGYHISEPDHTAAGDVQTLIDVYHALLAFAAPLQEEWKA